MADDGFGQIEAMLGALSNLSSDHHDDGLSDARCPKCNGSQFVKVSDLYDGAVARHEDPTLSPETANVAGIGDEEIFRRFTPPMRRSALGRTIAVALPLAAGVFYAFRRFGSDIGEFAAIGAGVLVVIVLLTTTRRLSDDYYAKRRRWRKTYMCRACGQLVAG